MKIERSDVEFLLWRKKVDWSLVHQGVTPIPGWVASLWEISEKFGSVVSKKDRKALVTIAFDGLDYQGWITCSKGPKTKSSPFFRLFCDDKLTLRLRQTYIMSYLRGLEARLRNVKEDVLFEEIPFWEFVDIEFDRDGRFLFQSHYKQKATFPRVFDIYFSKLNR